MNLQQLRYVVEIALHGNHLSAASEALHTSQSGVSRQLRLLESELGFEIYERTRNRLIGLTEQGRHVLEVAQRVVADVESLHTLQGDLSAASSEILTIATTHSHANYVLPDILGSFIKDSPNVEISLKEGDQESICGLVVDRQADLAIGSDHAGVYPGLITIPCFEFPRIVAAPDGHPILDEEELTLATISKYPLVLYGTGYDGSRKILSAFSEAGIVPNVALTAIDADVCKTYVRLGFGISILASLAHDAARDHGIGVRSAAHIFEPVRTYIKLLPSAKLNPHTLEFMRRLSPEISREKMRTNSSERAPLAIRR